MTRWLVPAIFVIGSTCVAADDPWAGRKAEPDEKPTHVAQIGVLVEFIEVDAATATQLVRKHAAEADSTRLRAQVQNLVDAEKAEEIDSAYLLTRPGMRAKVESITEFIYPTEYEPPGNWIAQQFDTDPESGLPIFPIPPQAFDIRNVGTSLEIEPGWETETGEISLNLAPERVDFVGFVLYGKGEMISQQPVFSVTKIQTNVIVPEGGYALLSMLVPHDRKAKQDAPVHSNPSKRILVFAKATVLKVPLKPEGNQSNHETEKK